jgi:GNAT superfamily N-acetyltransferase
MPDTAREDVRIRPLAETDIPGFLELVDGLADYEQLPRPTPEARGRLARDARAGRFEVLLAEVDGAAVGYAVFFMTYSTFRAQPSLYLEDLFVQPRARGQGAGKALFDTCAAEAVRRECGRMEWTVLDWNTPSIEFYRRKGARPMSEWLLYRLDDAALAAFGRADGETP